MGQQHTFNVGEATARVQRADAARFTRAQAPGSIDLIVTSPPYFVGKEYDRSRSISDFLKELRRVSSLLVNALKPGGSLCWQVGNHVQNGQLTPLDALIVSHFQKRSELVLRNRIIWSFNHGTNATTRFSGRHETILWYTKGEHAYFDLDSVRIPQIYPGKRHYKGPKRGLWSGNPLGKNPGDVWETGDIWRIPNVKAKHVEKTDHPCQFPVALARRLIVALCPPGGLVSDPYLGSGSTAVAALLEGRNFEGCDLEQRYVDITKDRLTLLLAEKLRFREDKPVREPRSEEKVAQTPPHFRSALRIANG